MLGILMISAGGLGALLFWISAKLAWARFIVVDSTSLSLFKLLLEQRKIDLNDIPDAALVEIILTKTSNIKSSTDTFERPHAQDHDGHLYLVLDAEAELISRILKNGPQRYAGMQTTQVLLKWAVVKPRFPPGMSASEFMEATKRGTLYAELTERVSLREES